MEKIAVFTPSYNRAYILSNLYNSLVGQTDKNFDWLVIDDGSTDNTKELVNAFIKDAKIDITYLYKNNSGKPAAINDAAKLAKGNWIFIVDSDDYLTYDAIEKVHYYLEDIKNDDSFAGIAGRRGNSKGKSLATKDCLKNKKYIDATVVQYRFVDKVRGDHAEVVRKSLLQKYPFPILNNEKFMLESYFWISLSNEGYKFRWFNDIIYICEYLDDGLTNAGKKLSYKNPLSKSYVENINLSVKELSLIHI